MLRLHVPVEMLAADPEELTLHLAYGDWNVEKKLLELHDSYSSRRRNRPPDSPGSFTYRGDFFHVLEVTDELDLRLHLAYALRCGRSEEVCRGRHPDAARR